MILTLREEWLKQGYRVHIVTAMINENLFPGLLDDDTITVLSHHGDNSGWNNIRSLWHFYFLHNQQPHYDGCLFSGVYAPLALRSIHASRNLYYCHTPPRFVYDLRQYYSRNSTFWLRPALALFRHVTRITYENSVKGMDSIIANSNNVARRLKRFLGQDAAVIHPPVDLEHYYWNVAGDYYLSTARLEPYKRVDRIIEAFRQMPEKRLIVMSSGSEESRLRDLAQGAANIEFTGWCSEQKKAELLAKCIATIYIPMDEDFGISPVESMAAGKPVIGVAEGGLLETVQPNKTGVLIPEEPTPNTIIHAVGQLNRDSAEKMRSSCESRAQQFGTSRFITQIMYLLAENRSQKGKIE